MSQVISAGHAGSDERHPLAGCSGSVRDAAAGWRALSSYAALLRLHRNSHATVCAGLPAMVHRGVPVNDVTVIAGPCQRGYVACTDCARAHEWAAAIWTQDGRDRLVVGP